MKKLLVFAVCVMWVAGGCVSSKKIEMAQLQNNGVELLKVNDARWDGIKVPDGEQGKTCGGTNPYFPSFTFDLKGLGTHFQQKVVGIDMFAYDVDWSGGHHGKWRYLFDPEKSSFTSPRIPGETSNLPDGVKGISRHTCKSCIPGYYLPPSSCRAGGGHRYFTDIIFTLENGEKVVTRFSQGVY